MASPGRSARAVWLLLGGAVLAACTGNDPSATSAESSTATSPTDATTAGSRPTTEPPATVTDDDPGVAPARLPDIVVPPWEPATRSEELAVQLASAEEVTAQMAVDAIGLALPDLPGQTPSDLPAGEPLGDHTTAQLAVTFHDQLSPAQQVVVDASFGVGTPIARIEPDGTLTELAPPEPDEPSDTSGMRSPRSAADTLDQYPAILSAVYDKWNVHLPDHPAITVQLVILPAGTPNTDHFAMQAATIDGLCTIEVSPNLWGDPATTFDGIAIVFAHEVFHCFQDQWATPEAVGRDWLFEGSADWAAADLFRNEFPPSLGEQWFDLIPPYPLAARSYSASPLFELAYQEGREVYPAIRAMLADVEPSTAHQLATGLLDGVIFRSKWATTSLNRAAWGGPWLFPSPFFASQPGDLDLYDVGVGLTSLLLQGGFTHRPVTVAVPDIVAVTPMGAPITTQTPEGPVMVAEGATAVFCFDEGGCACPGQPPRGIVMQPGGPYPGNILPIAAAVTDAGSIVNFEGDEFDEDECEDDQPGGGPSTGSSNGDPHLRTFDGLPYDIITLGEFVLVRDRSGELEVQTRHLPVGGGAGTSAVAIGSDGHRLTLTRRSLLDPGPTVVRLDGEIVTGSEIDVGEASASIVHDDVDVTWPDGSQVRLRWFLGWFVEVEAPPDRAAHLVGLLGSADQDPTNDLPLPDGRFADTVDAAVDGAPVVLQWAVDDETTLFDYEPGESAATFRVPHPDPTSVDADADALAACQAVFGTFALSSEVDACAYDVAMTGETGYVEVYESVVDRRVETDPDLVLPDRAEAPAPAPPGAPGQLGEPALVLGGSTLEGVVDTRAGTVLLAHLELCPEGAWVDLVVERGDDPTMLARAAVCDPDGLGAIGADDDDEVVAGEAYLWIPGDGSYRVSVDTLGREVEFGELLVFVDPEPTVVRAADLGSGGDARTLDAVADTVVYLTDPDLDYATTGLGVACAVEVYTADPFPDPEPVSLDRCDHTDRIHFPPSDRTIPIVVFAREPGPIGIAIEPDP